MPQTQLAPAGAARFFGLEDATIAYTGRDGSAVDLAGKMSLQSSDIEVMADVATGKDKDGEVQSIKPRNDRAQFSFSFAPLSTTARLAGDIAKNLPKIATLATITCAANSLVATPAGGTTVIDSCKARYSPDSEALIIDFTVTHWFGKVFTAITS